MRKFVQLPMDSYCTGYPATTCPGSGRMWTSRKPDERFIKSIWQQRNPKPYCQTRHLPCANKGAVEPSISMGTIQPYTRCQSAEGYRKLEVHGCPEGNENGNVARSGPNRINLTEDDVREPSQPERAASPGHFNDGRRQCHRRL